MGKLVIFTFAIFFLFQVRLAISSSMPKCAPSVTQRYLQNIATHIVKQAELLTEVELSEKGLFQTKIDEQTQASVRLEKDVLSFIKENGKKPTCLLPGWIDELTNHKNLALAAVQDLRKKILDKTEAVVLRIAAQIKEGVIEDATAQFKNISTKDGEAEAELAQIIDLAYSNTTDNFVNCYKFLWGLEWCSQVSIGYNVLFNMMKVNHQLTSPEILSLTGNGWKFCQSQLQNLSTEQAAYTGTILENWKESITTHGDFAHITKFFESVKSERYNSVLHSYLPELIRLAYGGQLGNFEIVFQFANSFYYGSTVTEARAAIYNEMKRSGHDASPEILRLIYKTRKTLQHFKKIENPLPLDLITTEKMETLTKSFPKVLRDMIRSEDGEKKCLITSENWNENLYSSSTHNTDEGDREVFTNISMTSQAQTPDLEEFWTFQAVDGDAGSFYIANSQVNGNNNFLAQDVTSKYDADRINVITTGKSSNSASSKKLTWKVVPHSIEDNGLSAVVSLKNDFGSFYMYAGNNTYNLDENTRRVFTLAKRIVPAASRWRISCQ